MFGDIQLHPEVEIESAHDHDHKILQENKLQMTLDDNFHPADSLQLFFLLDAAWVRSRAERPSVSYTKVTSKVAWTGQNCK